jgi:hypothetical protein
VWTAPRPVRPLVVVARLPVRMRAMHAPLITVTRGKEKKGQKQTVEASPNMKKRANAKKGSSSPDEAEALEVVDLSAGKSLLVKKVVRRGTGPVVPRKSR